MRIGCFAYRNVIGNFKKKKNKLQYTIKQQKNE